MKKTSRFAFVANTFSRVLSSRSERDKAPRSARLGLESLESRELLSASSWDVLPTCDELDLNPVENAAPLDASTPSCEALLAAIDETGDASPQDVFYKVAPPDSPETTIGEYELDEIVPNATTRVVTSLSDSINDAGSLRYLISIAQDGDTIKFDSSLNGKTITLVNDYLEIDKEISILGEDNAGNAVRVNIDGNNASKIFRIDRNATIKGIDISNGHSDRGGGILVYKSSLNLENVTISGCSSESDGGAILASRKAILNLENVSITNCCAQGLEDGTGFGGGIYVWYDATVTLNNASISNCSARGGGGICGFSNNGGTVFMTNSSISGCCAEEAGGIAATELSDFTLENVTISQCASTGWLYEGKYLVGWGGGIGGYGGNITATNVTISNCNAPCWGGGIGGYGGNITATNVTISNCNAPSGGGVALRGGDSGSTVVFTNSTINNNTATQDGGGIYVDDKNVDANFINTVINGNSTSGNGGGAVIVYGASAKFFQCLISENSANEGGGVGVYGGAILVSTTVAGNTASYGGGAAVVRPWNDGNAAELIAINSIIADNSASNSPDVYREGNNTSIRGGYTLSSFNSWNMNESCFVYNPNQPLFANAETGDYRLAPFSQAVDRGNNEGYIEAIMSNGDLAGAARIVNGVIDVGAYEYHPTPLPTLSASGTSTASTIALSWNGVAGAAGYEIVFNGTTRSLSATTTSCEFSSLQESTSYEFTIRAIGDGITFLNSPDAVLTVKTAVLTQLARPTLVASETGSNSITVNWDSVPNAASYAISYAIKSSSPQYETIQVAASKSSYTIDGLESNKNYYVKIQAKGDGIWYKDSQQSATVTTKTALAIPEFANISATASTITVNWNAVSGATGYEVICGGLATTFDATDRTATFAGLSPNASYSIQIKAFGNGTTTFDSDYSAIVKQATTPLVQLDRPVLALDAQTASSLTVTWDAIPNASSYVFSYAVKTSSPQYQTTQLAANATSYTIDGLEANKYYYVKIQALGDGIETTNSKQSATLTAKTSLATPTITSKSSTASTITVNWNPVSGATGYMILCGDQETTVEASQTSATFDGLTANTSFSLQIMAFGDGSTTFDSDYSPAVTQKTKALTKLDRPILTLDSRTSTTLTVDWDDIPNAEGYTVSIAVKSSSPVYETWDIDPFAPYTFDGLLPNTNYYVKVQARGDGVEYADSSQSPTLTVRTGLAVPEFKSKTAAAKSITVKWNAVSGAAGYEVVCGDRVATVDASKTTATFAGLTPNTTYPITIKALGNGTSTFDSDVSESVSLTTAAPPQLDRPVLTATARTSSTLTVNWEAIPNAIGYTISYAVKSTTPEYYTTTVAANATSATIEGLDSNTNYYVKVLAIADGVQFANSKQSATITYKTALAVPTIVENSATPTAITLTWDAVPSATGYAIVLGDQTTTVAASKTSATFEGLTASTRYPVQIKALGNGTSTFDSDLSAVAQYSTSAAVQLERPTLTATAQTSTTLTVSWDADPNVKSYIVSYAVKSSSPQYITKSVAATESSYTIAGLAANTNYYVKIQAKGDGVNYKDSKQSATITAKTALAAPTIASTSATANSIKVNWSAVSGAAGYVVFCGNKTANVSGSATSTTFTGLAAKTTYEITIKAKGNGTSTFDSDLSAAVTQETIGATQLARPVLTVAGTTSSSIAVAWEAIPNAQSYTISYAVKSTTPEYRTITLAGTATSFNITGLQANTNYYVKIRANGDGDSYLNSAQSATQTARTAAANSLAILDTAFDEEFFEEDLDELLAVNWLDD